MSEARQILPEEEQEEQLQEVACFDDSSAEYLMRRRREAIEQYDRMAAWYELNLKKAAEIRDNTIAWAERGLRSFLDVAPVKKTKTQISYELPSGKLVLKVQEPEYIRDDSALVPWMKQNGMDGMVKVKESANWAELKKQLKEGPDGTMVTEDGEIVPGVKAEHREPKFTVTMNEKIK